MQLLDYDLLVFHRRFTIVGRRAILIILLAYVFVLLRVGGNDGRSHSIHTHVSLFQVGNGLLMLQVSFLIRRGPDMLDVAFEVGVFLLVLVPLLAVLLLVAFVTVLISHL